MSISKAQAAALADKFLDDIGTDDKAGLRPKETFAEAVLLAGELIEDAQQNLNSSNNIASGNLSASLIAHDPYKVGATMQVDVYMNFYGRFINKGVKGTRSGSSSAGYAFKNEVVSKKMYKAISDWLTRGKISTMSVKKYTGHGKHETKQKGLGVLAEADKAYAVARSIKMKGIRGTGFLDKAVTSTTKKVADRLGAALRIDVINSLST